MNRVSIAKKQDRHSTAYGKRPPEHQKTSEVLWQLALAVFRIVWLWALPATVERAAMIRFGVLYGFGISFLVWTAAALITAICAASILVLGGLISQQVSLLLLVPSAVFWVTSILATVPMGFELILIPKLSTKVFDLKILHLYPANKRSVRLICRTIGSTKASSSLFLSGKFFEAHMKLKHQNKLRKALGKKQFLRLMKGDIQKLQATFSGSNTCFFIYTPFRIEKLRLKKPLDIVSGPVPTAIPPERAKPIQEHPAPWFVYIVRPGS